MKLSVSTSEPATNATFKHIFEYWLVLTRSGESLTLSLSGRFAKPGDHIHTGTYASVCAPMASMMPHYCETDEMLSSSGLGKWLQPSRGYRLWIRCS
jgi:hypothetical protein